MRSPSASICRFISISLRKLGIARGAAEISFTALPQSEDTAARQELNGVDVIDLDVLTTELEDLDGLNEEDIVDLPAVRSYSSIADEPAASPAAPAGDWEFVERSDTPSAAVCAAQGRKGGLRAFFSKIYR
eukprot:tig00000093_g3537.t1